MIVRDQVGEDVHHVLDRVNDLLDSKDAFIVGFDGRRTVSYVHGFTASPCQLELLNTEIERLVRRVVGGQPPVDQTATGIRDGTDAMRDRRDHTDPDYPLRRDDGRGSHSRVAHIGRQSIGSGSAAGDRRRAAGVHFG